MLTKLLIFILLISTVGCLKQNTNLPQIIIENDKAITIPIEAIKSIDLRVESVKVQNVSFDLLYNGVVKPIPNKTSYVASPVGGRVLNVFVDLNQFVNQGDKLAEISSHEVAKLQLDIVEKQINLNGELEQAKLELSLGETHYEREKGLFEQGIVAKKEFLDAENRYKRAKANLEILSKKKESITQVATKKLQIIGSTLENAISESGHVDIRAPQTGVVLKRLINPGEVVIENNALFEISDLRNIFLESNIYEQDLKEIMLGQEIVFYPQALPDLKFKGEISYIGHVTDPNTRTVPIRAKIENQDYRLKPEMFGKVVISLSEREAIAVNKKALQKVDEKYYVYVKKKKEYKEIEVKVGRGSGELVEITNGLKPNEKVVTKGSFWLKSKLHQI